MRCLKQKGYGLLLIVAVLVIVAGLVSTNYFKSAISYYSSKQLKHELYQLKQVKERLLRFAVLQPEIYLTNSASQLLDSSEVPAPGYFPCPDLDGDGILLGGETSCGNVYLPFVSNSHQTGFVPDPLNNSGGESCNGSSVCMGYVPQKIVSRQFYFAPAQRYFYVLDERFSFQNGYYVNNGLKRFAPLNKSILLQDRPRLTLNGVVGYVLLIIDAGSDGLDVRNSDGDFNFFSPKYMLNGNKEVDRIIGITLDEWNTLMSARVCSSLMRRNETVNNYPELANDQNHWLNDYHALYNPSGSGWRNSCRM
ncbi:Type 4 fimbrial biogenesis protein PilX N-terminal domain-containing protein [uncultured Thiomicrorhabdus sp.]